MPIAGGGIQIGPPRQSQADTDLWSRKPKANIQPWSLAAAKAFHEAIAEAEAQGTQVRMRPALSSVVEPTEPHFYAEPQPALPPKTTGSRSAG